MDAATRRRACIARALDIARCEGFVVGAGGVGKKSANPYSREASAIERGAQWSWLRGFREGREAFIRRLLDARREGLLAGQRRLTLEHNPYHEDSDDHGERTCAQVWIRGFRTGRDHCFRLTHHKLTSSRRDRSCVGRWSVATR